VIEPIRLSFLVSCSAEHAFAVWTEKASLWWPAGHTVSGETDTRVAFEPRVGGRIFERTSGGREIDWGEVRLWEPPRRLAFMWHMRVPRDQSTDVEITFADQGDGSTRVEIEHRGWERLGAVASDRREGNERGWSEMSRFFIAACVRADLHDNE
jgi:uncharacterized protein YndB with AHSA1/START domain